MPLPSVPLPFEPRLPESRKNTPLETDPLSNLCFQGSPYEVGRLHGSVLSRQVRQELELALSLHGGGVSDPNAAFARAKPFVAWIRRNLPGYLDEVHGLADGAGISVDAALFLAISDGLRPHPTDDCTAFYCGPESTRDHSVFLGQCKDTMQYGTDRYFVMRFQYDGGLEMVLLNYAGWLANIGLTSHGVAFTGNALYAKKQAPDCLPFSLLKRAILESRNVAEAMQFVEAETWQDGCLGIADRSGRATFVELVLGRAHSRIMTGEAFGHANSILTPECCDLDRSDEASPSSRVRQQTVEQILRDGSGDIDDKFLRDLLSNHRHAPDSICRHAQSPAEVRTTAAYIANLSEGWMDIAVGQPCSAPFHRHHVPYDG